MNATTVASFMSTPCFHKLWQLNMAVTCQECGTGEGHMNDLIGRVVAHGGADRMVAAGAVGIIPHFLCMEAPTAASRPLTLCPRGMVIPVSYPASSLPSLFGATGALTGVGTQLMRSMRSMERIQAVIRKAMTFAWHKAGEDAVGEIVGAIPGLGRLV
jgi:hypothetical protein